MPAIPTPTEAPLQMLTGWDQARVAAACQHCDSTYLLLPDTPPPICPTCASAPLAIMQDGLNQLPYTQPPELVIPFMISQDRLRYVLENFGRGWFNPPDLTPAHLWTRVKPVYLPMWLVDAEAEAQWMADAGYHYEVASHVERYHDGRWISQPVTETKIRWEPRLGRLKRAYQNISALALDPMPIPNDYRYDQVEMYDPAILQQALIRLPNRPPDDAWQDAMPGLRAAAEDECRVAAGANHIREFRWQPTFHRQNWTQMLLPALATYYLDADGKPQPVFVNGQTGAVIGVRRASMQAAQNLAMISAGAAVLALLLSLVVSGFMAGLLFLMMMGLLVFAVVPPLYVWLVNRQVSFNPADYVQIDLSLFDERSL